MILKLDDSARADSSILELIASPPVHRVLELTGTRELLRFRPPAIWPTRLADPVRHVIETAPRRLRASRHRGFVHKWAYAK